MPEVPSFSFCNFMYPHAEISGKQQDSLAPAEFTYKIISAKLVGTGVKL